MGEEGVPVEGADREHRHLTRDGEKQYLVPLVQKTGQLHSRTFQCKAAGTQKNAVSITKCPANASWSVDH